MVAAHGLAAISRKVAGDYVVGHVAVEVAAFLIKGLAVEWNWHNAQVPLKNLT